MTAPLHPSLLDLHMLMLFDPMERTETQRKAPLGCVGLKIVNVWSVPGNEAVVEAIIEQVSDGRRRAAHS